MTSLMTSLFNLAICGMAAAYMYEKWQARNKGGTNPENESEASQPKRAKGQQSEQFQLHKDLGIEVLGTQFEAPDSDGDSSASVIFSTENSSKHDLERFIARIWFETKDGHLLGGGLAEIEESVSTEDTSSMTANVNLIRLGGRTEGVRTHLSIIGCSAQRTKLERRTLPRDEGEEFVIFQTKSLAEGLTIEKVTVVISENEDGGGQLKLFYLVRNETFRSFPHIEIKTKLLSKTGKDLELTETAESIQPFSVGVIYDYIVLEKLSVLKNCQIECEAVVYEPVVIGEAQGTSMAILEAEHNDDDDDNDTYENSDSEDDAAEEDSQDELDTAESEHVPLSSDAISVKNDNSAYLIFLSDSPEDIQPDDLGPLVYPGSDNVGAIHPPRGFGEHILTEEQMAENDGAVSIEAVAMHIAELEEVLPGYFDVYGIHTEDGFFVVSLEEFMKLSKVGAYSHVKVVEIDNYA